MKRTIVFSFLLVMTLIFGVIESNFEYLPGAAYNGYVAYGDTNLFYTVSGRVNIGDNDDPFESGYVKALAYDKDKDLILTIDSARIQQGGYYSLPKCWRDSLFIMAYGDDELDGVPGYHDTTINWQMSFPVSFYTKHDNVNIKLNRSVRQYNGTFSVSGRVFDHPNNPAGYLKGAVVYARLGIEYIGYSVSDSSGRYHLDSLPAGNYEILVSRLGYYMDYRLIQIGQTNIDTVNFYLSKVASVNIPKWNIPKEYLLSQNYPNPFNPETRIRIEIPKSGLVKLTVLDVLGREVTTLIENILAPGVYEIRWDGKNYASGLYYYRLETHEFVDTKKMVLIK